MIEIVQLHIPLAIALVIGVKIIFHYPVMAVKRMGYNLHSSFAAVIRTAICYQPPTLYCQLHHLQTP